MKTGQILRMYNSQGLTGCKGWIARVQLILICPNLHIMESISHHFTLRDGHVLTSALYWKSRSSFWWFSTPLVSQEMMRVNFSWAFPAVAKLPGDKDRGTWLGLPSFPFLRRFLEMTLVLLSPKFLWSWRLTLEGEELSKSCMSPTMPRQTLVMFVVGKLDYLTPMYWTLLCM